jgi:hypothetical protein
MVCKALKPRPEGQNKFCGVVFPSRAIKAHTWFLKAKMLSKKTKKLNSLVE